MGRALRARLEGVLTQSELNQLYSSYDIIGDIAVIRVPEPLKPKSEAIGRAIMELHKHVKTVLMQTGPVHGELRLRRLEWAAGERRTETTHKEFGCLFKVDLGRCYFSPRLLHERMRIARLVSDGEIVINMFAGVGCFSIIIAKHSKVRRVYSIDINPDAIRYLKENAKLNRVSDIVIPILGDSKVVIRERLRGIADRVLMPLPLRAYEYLEYAKEALRSDGGWIHYYDFEHASRCEDPIEKVRRRVEERLNGLGVEFEVPYGRIIRSVGPRWYQVVLDIRALHP